MLPSSMANWKLLLITMEETGKNKQKEVKGYTAGSQERKSTNSWLMGLHKMKFILLLFLSCSRKLIAHCLHAQQLLVELLRNEIRTISRISSYCVHLVTYGMKIFLSTISLLRNSRERERERTSHKNSLSPSLSPHLFVFFLSPHVFAGMRKAADAARAVKIPGSLQCITFINISHI